MIQHRVWKAGKNTKVISIYKGIVDLLDVQTGDDITIDWMECIKNETIKVIRR